MPIAVAVLTMCDDDNRQRSIVLNTVQQLTCICEDLVGKYQDGIERAAKNNRRLKDAITSQLR